MRLVSGILRFRARLDALDTVGESTVSTHNVRAERVNFLAGVARGGDELALAALESSEARFEVIDRAANSATVVEDGIGVCGVLLLRVRVVGLANVLHFYGLLAYEECKRFYLARSARACHTILRWRRVVVRVRLAVAAAVSVVVLHRRGLLAVVPGNRGCYDLHQCCRLIKIA